MTDQELTQLQETGVVRFPSGVTLAEITEGISILGIDEDRVEISATIPGIKVEVQP